MKCDVYTIRNGAILCGAHISPALAEQLSALPLTDTVLRRLMSAVSAVLRWGGPGTVAALVTDPEPGIRFTRNDSTSGTVRELVVPTTQLTCGPSGLGGYIRLGVYLQGASDEPPKAFV